MSDSIRAELGNGKMIEVRKLLAKDVFELTNYEKKSDAARMTLHLATKIPLEELDSMELKDLGIVTKALKQVNPDISNLGFTEKDTKTSG